MDNKLKRSIGFGSAFSIVIGTIIGSGIFFKQASVLDSAGSTTMALLAWIFGGLITLAAGLTIADAHRPTRTAVEQVVVGTQVQAGIVE